MNYLKTPTLNKHAPINTVSRYMKQNWPNLFNPEVIEKMDQKKKKNPGIIWKINGKTLNSIINEMDYNIIEWSKSSA